MERKLNHSKNEAVSRRGFIKGAAVTALAAGATGTGAAFLQKQAQPVTISSAALPADAVQFAGPSVSTAPNQSELIVQLAQAQAENTALHSQLNLLQQQLHNLEQANQSDTVATDALRIELDNANNQIGVLAGLVALFEQLDSVEMDHVLQNGLTAVSTHLSQLLNEVPGLEEGVQLGQVALDEFEAHLPILHNGRQWLDQHLVQLRFRLNAIETILANSLEQFGPILNMLQDWFASIRKWLPFNIGQRAAEIMDTVTKLVLETPNTLAGMDTNVMQPLDVLLSPIGDAHPVQQKLIFPLREKLIAKTVTAVTNSKQLQTIYETELNAPILTAVDQQNSVRHLIAQYRQQHNI